jgi:hypothetical protein
MAATPEANYLYKLFDDTAFKAKQVVPYDDFLYSNEKQLDQLLQVHANKGKIVVLDKTCEHVHNEQQVIDIKNKLSQHNLLDRAIVFDNTADETYFEQHGVRHLYSEFYLWNYLVLAERPNPHPKKITHKWLCMNNFAKEHRWGIISALHNNDIIDQVLWSFRDTSKYFPNNPYAHYEFNVPTYIDQPLRKEGNQSSQAQHFDQNLNLNDIYAQVDYSIVTETDFEEPHITSCTEKSYLSMYYETLPIIVSVPGTVELLRTQGFDVFDDLIDHSYDSIINDINRFKQLVTIISHLNSQDTPSVDLYRHKFNRAHMTNKTYWHKRINDKLKSYQFS